MSILSLLGGLAGLLSLEFGSLVFLVCRHLSWLSWLVCRPVSVSGCTCILTVVMYRGISEQLMAGDGHGKASKKTW